MFVCSFSLFPSLCFAVHQNSQGSCRSWRGHLSITKYDQSLEKMQDALTKVFLHFMFANLILDRWRLKNGDYVQMQVIRLILVTWLRRAGEKKKTMSQAKLYFILSSLFGDTKISNTLGQYFVCLSADNHPSPFQPPPLTSHFLLHLEWQKWLFKGFTKLREIMKLQFNKKNQLVIAIVNFMLIQTSSVWLYLVYVSCVDDIKVTFTPIFNYTSNRELEDWPSGVRCNRE